jgi:hypothetical protein
MKNNKIHIKEATSDSNGGRGSYIPPIQPGLRPFKKSSLAPFTDAVSDFDSPLLQYDSYDGKMDERIDQIKKIEKQAKKITNYMKKHPYATFSDDDGNIVNQYPGGVPKLSIVPIKEWIDVDDILIEATITDTSSGEYSGPQELGLKKWKKNNLSPFTEFVDSDINHKKKQKTLKNNVNKKVGVWEKGSDGTYDNPTHDVHTINEDLAVWFGTKKKPKGSSQPKGPWVNICRKKEGGGHPPCGRPEASDKGYPKCRAAGVASKMTDAQKRSACQQKRKAEKTHSKSGTGNKPKMVSYKPKKTSKNESFEVRIKNYLLEFIKNKG